MKLQDCYTHDSTLVTIAQSLIVFTPCHDVFHVLQFLFLYFNVLHFQILQFPVRHFQSTRWCDQRRCRHAEPATTETRTETEIKCATYGVHTTETKAEKKVTKQLKRSAAVLAYFVSAFYVQMCDGRHFKHRFISVLFQFYFNWAGTLDRVGTWFAACCVSVLNWLSFCLSSETLTSLSLRAVRHWALSHVSLLHT